MLRDIFNTLRVMWDVLIANGFLYILGVWVLLLFCVIALNVMFYCMNQSRR